MAKSTFAEISAMLATAPLRRHFCAWLALFLPLIFLSEHCMAEQRISLGSGHFTVSFDPAAPNFRLKMVEVPGRCTPTLDIDSTDRGMQVHRRADGCGSDVYAVLTLNPRWVDDLTLHLQAGQLDLQPSVLTHARSLMAQVKAGDIFGHAGVRRSGFFGAQLSVENPELAPDNMTLTVIVGAGQITLMRQPASEAPTR